MRAITKNIIYISFQYPPGFSVIKNRAQKLTYGLAGKDFNLYVITPSKILENFTTEAKNFKVPKNISIIRTPYTDLIANASYLISKYQVFLPDSYIFWCLISLPVVLLKLRRKKIDLIYSTSPLPSTFIFGALLKLMKRCPLILEYRDPWSFNPYNHHLLDKYHKRLERKLLQFANGTIFVSDELHNFVAKYFGKIPSLSNSVIIPNGINASTQNISRLSKDRSDEMILVITSSLYDDRNPEPLYYLIDEARKAHLFDNFDFKLIIYGRYMIPNHEHYEKIYHLKEFVEIMGQKPNSECIQAQKNATLVVDISEIFDYPTFPAHFWEYFASGRKILYFGKKDSYKSNYIIRHQLGYILPLDNPEEMKRNFFQLINDYKLNHLEVKNEISANFFEENCWEKRIEKLSHYLSNVVKKSKP